MNSDVIFDFNKLPEYFKDFRCARVFLGGCGAVNSAVAEKLAKMGLGEIVICDYDKLEASNLSKSSGLYRCPEDLEKNKAHAMALRINELLGEDCAHGIDASITSFGPMAFADFDLVILGLDNYGAKVYFNQIRLQIPEEKRPIVIFGGTIGEAAQSNCLGRSRNDPCMRCLFTEGMLENPLAHSSCSGVQYRNDDPGLGIVVTTGLASGIAADFICEQARSVLLGHGSAVNKRIIYNAHPAFRVDEVEPMRRKSCPDCKTYYPHEGLSPLSGLNTLDASLRDLFKVVSANLGHDRYIITAAVIEYAKITYGKVIVNDFCKNCQKDLKGIYRHEFHVKYERVLCDDCRRDGRTAKSSEQLNKTVKCISAFSPKSAPDELLGKKLTDLGYRIGEIYEVRSFGDGTDFMDDDGKSLYFYFEEDQRLVRRINAVEG